MSFFGKNIKKIRTAKNLSQSLFAEIFGLTRAAVGAYEEGRAEAKIDTVIQIAEYFHLTLDQILRKAITINEITHFDKVEQNLIATTEPKIEVDHILYVPLNKADEYLNKYKELSFLSKLPELRIPGTKTEQFRAFEIPEDFWLTSLEVLKGETAIARRADLNQDSQQAMNHDIILITKYDFHAGKIIQLYLAYLCLQQNNGKIVEIPYDQINEIWFVKMVIKNQLTLTNNWENRLARMEAKIENLVAELRGIKKNN